MLGRKNLEPELEALPHLAEFGRGALGRLLGPLSAITREFHMVAGSVTFLLHSYPTSGRGTLDPGHDREHECH